SERSRSSSSSSSNARSYTASSTSGSSRTWYAYPQRFSCSRSSSAREAVLEDAKQLLRRLDEDVRVLDAVDSAPRDRDGEHARGLRGLHVERRVAHVGGVARRRVELCERVQDRLWMRLVQLRRVGADDDVEVLADPGTVEDAL